MSKNHVINRNSILNTRDIIGDSVNMKDMEEHTNCTVTHKDEIKKDDDKPHSYPKGGDDFQHELSEKNTTELNNERKDQTIHATLTGNPHAERVNFNKKSRLVNLERSTTKNLQSISKPKINTVSQPSKSIQTNKTSANIPSITESSEVRKGSHLTEQVKPTVKTNVHLNTVSMEPKLIGLPSHIETTQINKNPDTPSHKEPVKPSKDVGAIEQTIQPTITGNTTCSREATTITCIENPNNIIERRRLKETNVTPCESKSTLLESGPNKGQYVKIIQKLPSIGPLSISNLDDFLEQSKIDFDNLFNEKIIWNYRITDFNLIRTLGVGGFGKVVLGELKRDKTLYALKIIDKKGVVERHQVRYISNEKRVLQSINFPFVIYLQYFFTDFYNLYFVLPYVPGGNFSRHLKKAHLLKEADARFYIGQIVLALEYLHYLELIHRDIKTENIMIDAFGYLKLVDFGQCIRCYGSDKTWTFTGTPEYMAPEIIEGKGYDCAADWWSLGIITFEICAGFRPFKHENFFNLHLLILCTKYKIPSDFSSSLKSLIQGLLVREPKKRIANQSKKASALKKHVWFKGMDWLALLNRTLKAPYVPDLSKATHQQHAKPLGKT